MNRLVTCIVILYVLVLTPAFAGADDLGRTRLSLIQGEVEVMIRDTTDWASAAINLPLGERDRLRVGGDGRAELQVQGGIFVRADSGSAVEIMSVNVDSARFLLGRGRVYVNNQGGGIDDLRVEAGSVLISSYDESIMLLEAKDDEVAVSVLKGEVYGENRDGSTRISAGSALVFRGGHDARTGTVGAPDEWEQWNADRDREIYARYEGRRYLPEELHEYAPELDRNGEWEYVSEYGYVWTPAVTAPGWAPYSYGNWLWIRGSYVWIDYSPWGWAPSHYGRWVFIGTRWCWVPPAAGAVYWGPGFVGWVVTPSYVAWVPLAPGELYYGYGYYGPASVNITTININRLDVDRTFRNARARNSVTVVQRETFGTGRHAPVRIGENPFEERNVNRREVRAVPPRSRPESPIVVSPAARDRARQALPRREAGTSAPSMRQAPSAAPGTSGERIIRERSRQIPSGTVRTVPPAVQQQPGRVQRGRPEVLTRQPRQESPAPRTSPPVINRRSAPEGQTREVQPRNVTPRVEEQQQPQQPQRGGGLPRRNPDHG